MTTVIEPGYAPGVYTAEQVPAEAYHADPALSSTGARKLLECPAKFAYEREHGSAPTRAMEEGTAAHLAVLGVGPDIVVVEADNWRTKAAQKQADDARAQGAIPLLERDWDRVQAMAEAVRRHPVAGALFAPGDGQAEVSLFWTDRDTGVPCRARLDWLRPAREGRRLIVPDYKKTRDASPRAISKAVAEYGYHQQGAFYLDGVKACGLAGDQEPVFVLVCQEPEPPYMVTVAQLAPTALMLGAARNARARQIFRDCTASGVWPGYADDPITVALPTWAELRDEEYL